MVQFNLPQNSKILKGQYFKDKTGSSNLKIVHIYRWNPEKNDNPREDTFEVNIDACGNKVLDILIKSKMKWTHLLPLGDLVLMEFVDHVQ